MFAEGPRQRNHPEPPRKSLNALALQRMGLVWGTLAVLFCVWELVAYFLGLPSARAADIHPTISSLVEPFVAWPIGRVVFVALWLLAGVALLRKGGDR